MRNTMILIALSLVIGGCAHTYVQNPDPNHTHADFAVWVNGQKLDYSGTRYMTEDLTPAQEEELAHASGALVHHDIQTLRKYLHLHDGNGHVIHRHKPGLTLKDFFASLQIDISGNCYSSYEPMADGQECGDHPFRLFVNGKERTPFDLQYDFADMDHLLITNASTDAEVKKELLQMTDDACMYSKTCPWKGPAPTENCVSDPAVPCKEVTK